MHRLILVLQRSSANSGMALSVLMSVAWSTTIIADDVATPGSEPKVIISDSASAASDSPQNVSDPSSGPAAPEQQKPPSAANEGVPAGISPPAVPETTTEAGPATAEKEDSLRALGQLEISRPLSSVSLASALRAESVKGEPLNQPQDLAGPLFAAFGVYTDPPSACRSTAPRRNLYPICYNPLYLEDPNLERCGVGHGCFTELVSAARFFGRVPVLPYMMGAEPPFHCVPSLGDCPACHSFGCDAYIPPPSAEGFALQALMTVGLIFVLP